MMSVGNDALDRVCGRLGDIVIDPQQWPTLLTDLSVAIGARGAGLLQTDVRTQDIPRSTSIDETFADYFASGWHVAGDLRTRGVSRSLKGEVFGDDDVVTPEEMRRDPFYDTFLRRHGLRWFAGVPFRAGTAVWCVSIQRTPQQGMFTPQEKRLLASVCPSLTEAATLSKAFGQAALDGTLDGLAAVSQPAIALHRTGRVLGMNAAAAGLLSDAFFVQRGRLVAADSRASAKIARLLEKLAQLRHGEPLAIAPIVVPRSGRATLTIHAAAMQGSARSIFLGASALLMINDLGAPRRWSAELVRSSLGLTPAETRLVLMLADGHTLTQAAQKQGITDGTARIQLKSVFAKTDTRRQSELMMLVHRLPNISE
jgi:DNA-binding CsgD family transcriptional regulator